MYWSNVTCVFHAPNLQSKWTYPLVNVDILIKLAFFEKPWFLIVHLQMSQPHFGPTLAKCKDETHTLKVGDLESSGIPKNSELDCRDQNTSHWGFIDIIGKVLKFRCSKWPHMSHLNICSLSYGQKKGRESNWQFDSWSQKVRNRPNPDVRWGSATWRWKALEENYKIGWDLVQIGGRGEKLWWPKVSGVQTGTVSGLHFGSPGTKSHLVVGAVEQRREYYMGEGGGFPRVQVVMNQVSPRSPVACPNTKKVQNEFQPTCG
jgi:hypothetical protein